MSSAQNVKLPPMAAARDKDAKINPRRMRRIIIEDPSWNTSSIPSLLNLCLSKILLDFETNPQLDAIPAQFRDHIVNNIDTSLPLELTASLISEESYWRRSAAKSFPQKSIDNHDGSWKQLYFENYLQSAIEKFVPGVSSDQGLQRTIKLAAPFVKRLCLRELQPPTSASPLDEEPSSAPLPPSTAIDLNVDLDEADDVDEDHIDLGGVLELLPACKHLNVSYKVAECGMKFKWSLFGMTSGDALLLGDCVKYSSQLSTLTVTHSLIDDKKCRMMVAKFLDNDYLEHVDLSHNCIGDRGARAFGKLLHGHSQLSALDLVDNQIAAVGARALGAGLSSNTLLTSLNLRLNNLGDQGASALLAALEKNTTLTHLNLSCNNMTSLVSSALSEFLEQNQAIVHLDITGNDLKDDTGKKVLDALDRNTTIRGMDTRLTGFSKETEIAITDILRANMKRHTEKA